jgi:hypothetical protein
MTDPQTAPAPQSCSLPAMQASGLTINIFFPVVKTNRTSSAKPLNGPTDLHPFDHAAQRKDQTPGSAKNAMDSQES